ncbi:MAG: hypothetical protein AAGF30_16240 [Pseudomonadota bacterium]
MSWVSRLAALVAVLSLMACTSSLREEEDPRPGTEAEIVALTEAIADLGPGVDPAEARRAAALAYSQTYRLAQEYEIVDPPLIHNTKVNMGRKPRGLCWHWADDLQVALAAEDFQTLELHRAIANYDRLLRIEHSTVIVSARGDDMLAGLVLDPWRRGGLLTWVPTADDHRYVWEPELDVLRDRYARKVARGEAPPGGTVVAR